MSVMEGEMGTRRVGGREGGSRWLRQSHAMEDACRPVLARHGTGAFLPLQQQRHPPFIADQSPPRNDSRKLSGHRRGPPATLTEKYAAGGPGMHAVFMHPTPRSCGTGFFLPRCSGDGHPMQQNKKPVCSPVLLPSRVVHLLNLDGQVAHPPMANPKENNQVKNHNPTTSATGDDGELSRRRCQECYNVHSQSCSSTSLEVLLPEEWSY